MKVLAGMLIFSSLSTTLRADGTISIQNSFCSATFDPATLELSFKPTDKPAVRLSVGQTNLGKIANLNRSASNAGWSLPDRKISVTLELNEAALVAHVL